MYALRLTQLLLVALSATSVVQSMAVNSEVLGIDATENLIEAGRLLRRQGTPTTGRPTSSITSPTSESTKPTSSPPTSRPPPTSTPPTTTSAPPPTSIVTSEPPTSKTSEPPRPTNIVTSSQTTPEPITSTTIITTHAPDGSPTTVTSANVYMPSGSLSQGGGASTTSEMSQDTKNIIIGTVVGIGGAIVLGVAGYLAWRIWGKKKAAEENDGLMSYGGDYAPEAKPEAAGSVSTRTPFQSTLESYHAPTQVNTASNF